MSPNIDSLTEKTAPSRPTYSTRGKVKRSSSDVPDDDEEYTFEERPPQKVSKNTRKIVEAYWKKKGVTTKVHLQKLVDMAGNRSLYGDFDRVEIKLSQFEAVLPGIDVVKLVANAPNLLVYDVEGTIPKKVQRLQVLLPGVDVVKLVSSSPHLLTFDIENNIAPKVEQLYKLLPGANVVKIVCSAPNLLSYDVENSLKVKVDQLKNLLPGADVIKLISYAPTLLYHDTETSIAPKIRLLKDLLPDCDVVKMVCAAPALLCSDIEGSVARKILWILEMVEGTAIEIKSKIESNPRLLTCGYGVVFGRIEFFYNTYNNYVPIHLLRSTLLSPVAKFESDHKGYRQFLAQQLTNAEWGNKSYEQWCELSVKKLESDYGVCLRAVVNKA